MIRHPFLFNFAASPVGGGLKRLYHYAQWFDQQGGAYFVVHPRAKHLADEFRNNRMFCPGQPQYQRLFRDCAYLGRIVREIGTPDLYFAFNIPMYHKVGRINWFHLSNLATLRVRGTPLTWLDWAKFSLLGRRIKATLHNADVISAESAHSFQYFDPSLSARFVLSVLGSDDELAEPAKSEDEALDDVATVVGTISYKALDDSYRVFEMLRRNGPLTLQIVGEPTLVPRWLRQKRDVVVAGMLPRPEVIALLRRSRYYISTTVVENSYNAASEGVHLAAESYISDIPVHRELLAGERFEQVTVSGTRLPLLRVRRADLSRHNLRSWQQIIREVVDITRTRLDSLHGATIA